jgi:glycogen debranching enzyme
MYERKSAELALRLFGETPFSSFNHLLFRCESEEREISGGKRGPYGLEKYGVFTYSGIASFMTILRDLKVNGDMGHELFNNMRAGDWYLDYAKDRLGFMQSELKPLIEFLNAHYGYIKALP